MGLFGGFGGRGWWGCWGRFGGVAEGHFLHVDAELWVGLGAVDGDGDLDAGFAFAEEAVEWLEQEALQAGGHLRGCGVCLDDAVEVEEGAVEARAALHADAASGELELGVGDVDECVCDVVGTAHGGGDDGGVVVVGFLWTALGPHAELVDGLLELFVGEGGSVDGEVSLEVHLLRDADGAGRDIEFGVQGEGSVHEGRAGFDAEAEHVFDAGVGGVDLEGDVMTGGA